MTQTEFRQWVESILGNMPMEEVISTDILAHMNRLQLQAEEAAWNFAREESRESFEMTIRAMCKTMFSIGYDAGRDQAHIDSMFGEGSGFDEEEGGGGSLTT
jgi:hypothetical protein